MSQASAPTKRTIKLFIAGFAAFTCCAGIATFGAVYTLLGNQGGGGGTAAGGPTPGTITQVAQQTPLAGITPTVAATPTTAAAGGGSTGSGEAAITVLEVVDPVTPGAAYSPKAGTRLVGVHLVIENGYEQSITINGQSISLADAAGATYAAEVGAADTYSALPPMNLLASERADGWAFFAVPEGAMPATINLNDTTGLVMTSAETSATPVDTWSTITAPDPLVAELQGYRLKVSNVTDPAPPSELYTAATGTRLVLFEIKLLNEQGAGPMKIDPANLLVIDDHGFVHAPIPGAVERELSAAEILKGEDVKGFVVYEIPNGYVPLYVRYLLDVLGTPEGLMISAVPVD